MAKDIKQYEVKLKLDNQLKFSNYGCTSVAYQATEGNWLNIKSNMDNSLFGRLLSKGLLGSGTAALDKNLDENWAEQQVLNSQTLKQPNNKIEV